MCECSHWHSPFLFEKYCKLVEALAAIPFFYDECVNLKSLQQQFQLFIKYSKFFKKSIVFICTCNGDFRNNYFLQRAALSEHLV